MIKNREISTLPLMYKKPDSSQSQLNRLFFPRVRVLLSNFDRVLRSKVIAFEHLNTRHAKDHRRQ